ncbi:hypothetical protein K439DRAFT_1617763 [Ramaria rubella]|nr:hypothetical protein K439DRAFT_1617763 [Ramaria rubella]
MAAYPECPLPASTICQTYLTRGQSIGLTVATVTGFVSAGAVLYLFCLVAIKIMQSKLYTPDDKWKFFRSPLDAYMASLLASDFLQSVGKLLHVKWLNSGIVQCGSYCTTQGLIQQLGETGVAQATLAIAVHTFVIIFFRRGSSAITLSLFIVMAIWLYVIVFAIIGATILRDGDNRYITPDPYWCWIGTKHVWAQLAGEYGWIWLTALLSLVLYIPLYFCLRGYIEVDRERWWNIRICHNPTAKLASQSRDPYIISAPSRPTREAFVMLLYPISYVIMVLPDSICRWREFRDQHTPSAATFFSTSLFGLSGLVNVVLLLYTRPGLLLLNVSPSRSMPERNWGVSSSIASSAGEDTGMRIRPVSSILNRIEG